MFQLRKLFNNHFQSKNSSFIFKQKGKSLKLFLLKSLEIKIQLKGNSRLSFQIKHYKSEDENEFLKEKKFQIQLEIN